MTERELDPVPAEAIEDFGALDLTQTGINRYLVGNRESGTVWEVRLSDPPECDCPDFKYSPIGSASKACKHIAYAVYQAPETTPASVHALRQVANEQTHLTETVQRLEQTAAELEAIAAGVGSTGGSGGGGGGDDEEGETPDPIDDPGDAAQGMIQAFDGWLPQAAKFDPDADEDAFDMGIVDLTWAEFQGEEGIWIDVAPFYADGYYDSEEGEWIDQEAYDEAREAVVEVFQKRDEVLYTGPPEYVNFIASDAVEEVVG